MRTATVSNSLTGSDDLEWMARRRDKRRPLSVEMINTDISGRDYQIAAIRSLLEGIEARRKKFLLVMATGTGKTRVAMGLVEVLLRARWAKRVLFLVDRIALRDQALDAFKEHIPNEPRWPVPEDRGFVQNRRVYVATYPTILNQIQAGTTRDNWLSPHFFDLVVADESHRSIYNVYEQVLDYFSTIKVGLTATPTDHIDHDTFKLFECDVHDPTFAYTYEEATEHDPPYLSDFEVLKVRSKFQLEGIKGKALPKAVQRKLVAQGKDPADIDFEGTDLERKVTNSGTNAFIVREYMEESIKDPSGTLPGKTIIFAISIGHARRLQEIFDKLYPEHAGVLARVLVSTDPRVHGKGGLLDQFKTQNMPRIAISVDMLDTGVDVLEVVNLVFAKPVYSYTKFWQMIGRGTRVLHDDPSKRRPWCPEKDRFLIIDCWGNFDFFKMKPKGREPGTQVPLPVRLFKARLDKLEAAISVERQDAVEAAKGGLRADLADLPENNVVVAENREHLDRVAADGFWERTSAADLGFLRSTVAPVLRARSSADFKAMRFETDVVELGRLIMLGHDEPASIIRNTVLDQIRSLPLTVNTVQRQQHLISEVQEAAWWVDASEAKLQSLIDRLAPLMRLRQRSKPTMVKLDLKDKRAVKETVEFGPESQRMTVSAYREKVEAHILSLVDENPVLRKLKAGQDVNDTEVMQLAQLLREQDPHVTEDLLRKVYDHKTARFIQFMRHILGQEKLTSWSAAITSAFDSFIAEHTTLTAMQIRFLQTLRTFILQTGGVEKRDLIAAPFTQIHPRGIRGVFSPDEASKIIEFTNSLVA